MQKRSTKAPRHLKPLRLQHHRHTGRLLHHRHTSYHGLAIVIGLAGALMLGVSMMAKAAADTLDVYARNPAPLPTVAAVITNPADKTTINTPHLQLDGTCEVASPANIVTILDNSQIAGSAPCRDDGTFSLSIMIDPGEHTLIARTYTITDGVGPDSAPITVFRVVDSGTDTGSPPATTDQPGGGSGGDGGGGQPAVDPLRVTTDQPFITFGPGKDAVWTGAITGGKPPYLVQINWNDGDVDEYTILAAGQQSFSHRYSNMWPHLVTLQVTDDADQTVIRQFAAVTPYVPPATTTGPPAPPWNGSFLAGIYGAYLLVLAVFGALWVWTHPTAYAPVRIPVRHHPARHVRRRARGAR